MIVTAIQSEEDGDEEEELPHRTLPGGDVLAQDEEDW